MIVLQSFLSSYIQKFIRYRKATQHWNEASYEPNIILFDKHCFKYFPNNKILTQEMVFSWCQQRRNEKNNSCRSRIYVIHSFIRYLRERGLTDVYEPNLPKKEKSLYIPHAFTNEELTLFFYQCDHISATITNNIGYIRKITIPVYFRLLYSSGIRTNEARLLRTIDVDLSNGVLNIKYSKGHNQHYVVLHDTMLQLLQRYNEVIKIIYPNRTYFFPSKDDSFFKRNWVSKNFRILWNSVNPAYATAYELRHHYAITNINLWIDKGFKFDANMLYLSRSMGHTTLESTKYYYNIVPAMSHILQDKTQDGFDWIVPEVNNEEIID